MSSSIPKFSDLPLDKNGPHHNAWGLYGPDDELGTLNRLSDPLVAAAAASEIRTGVRINLDLPLNVFADRPFFGRQAFNQHAYQKQPRVVNDDVWTFNTQSSSQWDGYLHFGYQKAARFYNNVSLADIHGPSEVGGTEAGGSKRENPTDVAGGPHPETSPSRPKPQGIGAWAQKGGIVGRGVLLDVWSWSQSQSPSPSTPPYNPLTTHAIPASTLRAVAAAQGVDFQFADILLVRTGYTETFRQLSAEELESLRARPVGQFVGLQAGEETMEFLWENFAACGGDQPAFEAWPPAGGDEGSLHEVLLAGWGMPIGEFWDLEGLATHCRETGRWSFFVVSQPVYVPGGVATPANMVAIF